MGACARAVPTQRAITAGAAPGGFPCVHLQRRKGSHVQCWPWTLRMHRDHDHLRIRSAVLLPAFLVHGGPILCTLGGQGWPPARIPQASRACTAYGHVHTPVETNINATCACYRYSSGNGVSVYVRLRSSSGWVPPHLSPTLLATWHMPLATHFAFSSSPKAPIWPALF